MSSVAPTYSPTYCFRFAGSAGSLFLPWLKWVLLTVLTFSIYRFWFKNNLRVYLWSNTRLADSPFEYHGTGMELLVGMMKAFAAFVGVGIVAAILGMVLSGSTKITDQGSTASMIFTAIFYVAVFVLAPVAVRGTWAYRVRRTSWRGTHFQYLGTIEEFAPVFWTGAILTVVTLGFYYPFFTANLRRTLVNRTTWGTIALESRFDGRQLLQLWIICLLLALPTLFLSLLWFVGLREKTFIDTLSVPSARFTASFTPASYALLMITNVLGVLFSLGLAIPWMTCRTARFFLEQTTIHGELFEFPNAPAPAPAEGSGEGLMSLLDVDFGF